MTTNEKWQILLTAYNQRRAKHIIPTAVPQKQLIESGISLADILSWNELGMVRILRTINDNIVKPLKNKSI